MSSLSEGFIALHKSDFPAVKSVKCCCAGKKHTFAVKKDNLFVVVLARALYKMASGNITVH